MKDVTAGSSASTIFTVVPVSFVGLGKYSIFVLLIFSPCLSNTTLHYFKQFNMLQKRNKKDSSSYRNKIITNQTTLIDTTRSGRTKTCCVILYFFYFYCFLPCFQLRGAGWGRGQCTRGGGSWWSFPATSSRGFLPSSGRGTSRQSNRRLDRRWMRGDPSTLECKSDVKEIVTCSFYVIK